MLVLFQSRCDQLLIERLILNVLGKALRDLTAILCFAIETLLEVSLFLGICCEHRVEMSASRVVLAVRHDGDQRTGPNPPMQLESVVATDGGRLCDRDWFGQSYLFRFCRHANVARCVPKDPNVLIHVRLFCSLRAVLFAALRAG